MRFRPCLCALIVGLTALINPLGAQSPREQDRPGVTIRVNTDLIAIDVTATDASGDYVRDLRADEFQLLEDGKPQTISAFSFVDVPLERQSHPLFASAPIDPDVFTNTATEGRLYLIVISVTPTVCDTEALGLGRGRSSCCAKVAPAARNDSRPAATAVRDRRVLIFGFSL